MYEMYGNLMNIPRDGLDTETGFDWLFTDFFDVHPHLIGSDVRGFLTETSPFNGGKVG